LLLEFALPLRSLPCLFHPLLTLLAVASLLLGLNLLELLWQPVEEVNELVEANSIPSGVMKLKQLLGVARG
jgi:hypothetical protein